VSSPEGVPQAAPEGVPADVEIDAALVRSLLEAQHPDLRELPLRFLAEGWDNALYRLGDALVVRLPRRALGARWLDKELRWLPHLAPALPVPVPVPVRRGAPTAAYPFRWSIVPWLEGEVAGVAPLAHTGGLAGFLQALHRPAPPEALADPGLDNPFRSCAVGERGDSVTERLVARGGDPLLEAAFARGAEAEPWTASPVWVHGDLHPFNVLTRGGRLTAVLDWGDALVGDPAVDLAAMWALLPTAAHGELRGALGHDAATWDRARAWAVFFGLMLSHAGTRGAGAAFHAAGERILDRVRLTPLA
jgi:aminoglycoside phosphotransferase (APT) family kinase protein